MFESLCRPGASIMTKGLSALVAFTFPSCKTALGLAGGVAATGWWPTCEFSIWGSKGCGLAVSCCMFPVIAFNNKLASDPISDGCGIATAASGGAA